MQPVCGSCGSANVLRTSGCDTLYVVCQDCLRLQEAEIRANPARQLCDNCAFRPGSPEQSDPYGWMRMREKHIEDGIPFYCHKGLKLELDGTKAKFAPDSDDEMRRKPCAGWWSQRMGYLARLGSSDPDAVGQSDALFEDAAQQSEKSE